jgi:hypothetical protein
MAGARGGTGAEIKFRTPDRHHWIKYFAYGGISLALAALYGLDPVAWTPRKRGCSSWDAHVGGSLLSTKTKP